ncbi:hypothetical protein PRIC1_008698 [Phytophthora ramorum]|uniref:Heat shock transcription factor n=1 Tax=Phytophthora ramorum TaxID=164328 RepID=C0LZI6_PHYRM|nr:heat shock transcription factor [Phytophthora ramorum]KAH7505443.1 Heat shock factor protein [Phytophthora ramorum]KAH7505444.1 Heat shock factor protein [Phytophthora ramorum]KAH7505446.1 Heat shock factor protein [Phytophthora ramorum]KAH7505447.1 Heat shock factor protein [Phytophthora ramorum]
MNSHNESAFATVPRFVRSVYDMLQNEDQRILSWSADGSHFQVYDVPRLEVDVLRKYFKHGKFSSFQRQLNNFGFHKWTKTRASVATFNHDVLVRCHPSQLSALVGQMKKKVATTPTSPTTSAKRPRSLLASTTTVTVMVEPMMASKKQRMSPRDVCDLSAISFSSLWAPDGSCNQDEPLFDALDSIELTELDWHAVSSPIEADACDTNGISAIGVDLDLQANCAASGLGLLGEEDLCAILGDLETAQELSERELNALLGGASDREEVDLALDGDIEFDIAVDAGVDSLLFV